ncbi:MAG TPA: diguanylate cyclase, partial [Polyangiaceae bacterium]|nr:diguanylate cyclase [Polyangiaceae bacterium]
MTTKAPEQTRPPRIRLSLRWQILLACTVPVLLMLANEALDSFALDRSVASTEWVTHTNRVIGNATALGRTIADAESGERGFLLSRDSKQLEPYEGAVSTFWQMTASLETLVADNPLQLKRAREITSLFEQWRAGVAEPTIRSASGAGGVTPGGEHLIGSIRSTLDEFIATERRLLAERATVADATIAEARALSTFGTVLSVLVAVSIAVYLSTSVGRSIAELAAAAHELAGGSLTRRAVVTRRDEVGRLAQSFNSMADALIERTRESERVASLGEELQSSLTIAEAGAAFRRFATLPLPKGAGAMFLVSASRNLLVKSFDWGHTNVDTLAPEDCFALRKGHAHYVDDTSVGGVCPHVAPDGPSSSACIPLMAHGETLGILHMESSPGDVDGVRRAFAGAVAEQLALTVANLQLREKLYGQAIRDPLTGLFNRRYLEETLPRELARADRSGQVLGVLAIDVDHFKRFNDTFGHDAGDLVLRELGALLRASFRSSDISVRLGGEEFVVILPDTDKGKLIRRAEWLGTAVRNLALVHREISLGT